MVAKGGVGCPVVVRRALGGLDRHAVDESLDNRDDDGNRGHTDGPEGDVGETPAVERDEDEERKLREVLKEGVGEAGKFEAALVGVAHRRGKGAKTKDLDEER